MANEIRDRVRLIPFAALVVVIVIGLWVRVVVFVFSNPYPTCPEPIGNYTGECAVDDGEGGYFLFRYENGQQCGSRYLPAGSDGYEIGQTCL